MIRCEHGFLRALCVARGCPHYAPRRQGEARVYGKRGTPEDMTGRRIAGVVVICRAENTAHGNTRWTVEHPCGCREDVEGGALRAAERDGRVRKCKTCDRATTEKRRVGT